MHMSTSSGTPIDNEAVRELRDSLKELNISLEKSGKRMEFLTYAMFTVALFQLLLAIFQFIISFAYSDNLQLKIFGIIMTIITICVSVVPFRMILKYK